MPKPKTDAIAAIVISETCWMYPESGGLCVVQEARGKRGELISSTSTVLPWSKVDAARKLRKA